MDTHGHSPHATRKTPLSTPRPRGSSTQQRSKPAPLDVTGTKTDPSIYKVKVAKITYIEYAGAGVAHYKGPKENLQGKAYETMYMPVETDPTKALYSVA